MVYLFGKFSSGETFFCGNMYENKDAADIINYHGCPMTFGECVEEGLCLDFGVKVDAVNYSNSQYDSMADSWKFASEAERDEELFGTEGVDNCLNDY